MQTSPGGENICLLIDYVEDKKDLFLVYELCSGKTLNEWLFDVKSGHTEHWSCFHRLKVLFVFPFF